ncbi:MAG: multifunctional CCA tRNA nucleotidyl transferase/2'3'-cyclic phosphodiesterase/2'nucleotidase/phosphatase [Halobacteriovoraceae bacterium]|nr:multifunctional CCA tRNA nucleotidyl transferase/2'3'-cyclic phosphodiesterase/2'nucleotidase/phosphatase [Halobacteriovoraceae bacterium]MCB9095610.1 multifunctional CCA tRNA nucleotidyl transferase/2'3'-cyclic phosphodiesterase/2'nucleotidase/phosphatase [Halobacteriovoraceae bacterium]
MKIYLVGGAVRDLLIGKSGSDRDYVVVGATPEEMKSRGFSEVGKNFPVYLHPKTKEEYALARKEKKVSPGHQGFQFEYHKKITLEEDLLRRDFTVNAMAMEEDGTLIDPYGGREDLKKKLLRHVSKHFVEDPLRVIRGCRFAATLGFEIEPQTQKLMKDMVSSGELDSLSSERILTELMKVLESSGISRFVDELKNCGALSTVFPGFDFTPEAKNELSKLEQSSLTKIEKFAYLFCYLKEEEQYFSQFTIPNQYKKLAKAFCGNLSSIGNDFNQKPSNVLQFFKSLRMDEKIFQSLIELYQLKFPAKDFSKLISTFHELKAQKFTAKDSKEEIERHQLESITRVYLS